MSKGSKEVWNLEDRHVGRIKAVATTCDTEDGLPYVITGGEDRNIYIMNANTGELVRQIDAFNGRPGHPGHRDMIYVIKVWNTTSGEHRIISTGEDKLIRVFDLDTGKDLFTLEGHSEYVLQLVVIEAANQLVSASYDRTIKIWNLLTQEELRVIKQDRSLYDIAINLEAGCIASTSSNEINVWNIAAETKKDLVLRIHKRTVVKLLWPQRDLLISSSDDSLICIWDPTHSEEPLLHRLEHNSPSYTLDLYQDDKLFLLITGCFAKPHSVRVWNMEDYKLIESYVGHSDKVVCVSNLTDGSPINPTRNDPGTKAKRKKKDKKKKKKKKKGGDSETEDEEEDLEPPEFRRIASVGWDGSVRMWDFQPIIEQLHRAKHNEAAQQSRMI
jgi:WD40 repeat protein